MWGGKEHNAPLPLTPYLRDQSQRLQGRCQGLFLPRRSAASKRFRASVATSPDILCKKRWYFIFNRIRAVFPLSMCSDKPDKSHSVAYGFILHIWYSHRNKNVSCFERSSTPANTDKEEKQLRFERRPLIINSANKKDSELIRVNVIDLSFNSGLAWAKWLPSIHIFYVSGQHRDEIQPVTGKAILCNGSCFTVATFQKEVQYLNMWYPVPNHSSEQPLL